MKPEQLKEIVRNLEETERLLREGVESITRARSRFDALINMPPEAGVHTLRMANMSLGAGKSWVEEAWTKLEKVERLV